MSDVAVKSGNFSPKAALRHEAIESINGHEVLIDAPKPMDVICGRGKNIAHPGRTRNQVSLNEGVQRLLSSSIFSNELTVYAQFI
jgi:hypothetical protein